MTPGRLEVGPDGKVTGPANISHNDPFPTKNGTAGGGSSTMLGVVIHTENGFEQGTIATFNDSASQASAFFAVGLDGAIWQFGPVGKNWMAWAQEAGNPDWYSIEDADNHPGKPPITEPFSDAQVTAIAQLVELLSRFAGFPLQVTDSVYTPGVGKHSMGGVPWGDHPYCPGDVRASQRERIVELAKDIRAGAAPPPPPPPELEGILVQLPGGGSRKILSRDGGKNWA